MRNLVLGLGVLLAACSSPTVVATCTPGRSESCACTDGRSGAQVCTADGIFGACECVGAADAGALRDASAMDAASVQDAAPNADATASDDGATDAASVDAASLPDAWSPPPPGHIVLLGGHMLQPFPDGRAMLINAVALSETTGPIRVLDYAEFTDTIGWNPRSILRPEIDTGLAAMGRSATYSSLESFVDLGSMLPTADVLLVYAQWFGARAQMDTIAATWRAPLATFLARGGVVIVLDSTRTGSSARGYAYRLVAGPGLLSLDSEVTELSNGTLVDIATPGDAIATGTLSHTTPNEVVCFPGASGGTTVARTRDTLCATSIHGVRGSAP